MSWQPRSPRIVGVLVALATTSCSLPPDSTLPGAGTNEETVQVCLGCHPSRGDFRDTSAHGLLFDCITCHSPSGASGPGHATSPECSDCHTQQAHPAGEPCVTCHDPHGSPNLYGIRSTLTTAAGQSVPIHFTRPEGQSPDGLVRSGAAGTASGVGLCQACHRSTAAYRADGTGEAHSGEWCATCHDHLQGFGVGAD